MNVKYILLFAMALVAGVGMPLLPDMAILLMMLLTVSVALITYKKGSSYGLAALLLSVAANSAAGLSFFWAVLCLAAGLAGFYLGTGLVQKYSLQQLLTYSAGGFLLSIMLVIFGVLVFSNKYIIKEALDTYFSYIKDAYSILLNNPGIGSLGMIPEGMSIEEYRLNIFANLDMMQKTIAVIMPSIFVIGSGLYAYICFGITRLILLKYGTHFYYLPSFSYLRMTRKSGWILIAAWVLPNFFENEMIKTAFVNLTMLIIFLFGFCAFSFIEYTFKKRVKSAWLRTIIYISTFFTFSAMLGITAFFDLFSTVLIMIGMADSILDLRNFQVGIKRG